ncbi:MAG: TIGR03087 family PEP-CTERM/XrtA system glycosyltransferase [Candidatus Thorarchaeota archaeon]
MKILYLAHRIPYPPNKGDKIRSFNEIKYISHSHEVHLACLADNSADLIFRNDLQQYCSHVCVVPLNTAKARVKSVASLISKTPLSVGYFYSKALQRTIDQWLSSHSYNAIICFSSPMAEYIFRSTVFKFKQAYALRFAPGAGRSRPRLIMDFCDLDSDKWLQYSRRQQFPLNLFYGIEHRHLLKYEKKINKYFDYSVFVSEQEFDLFSRSDPGARNVSVISNGVDCEYFSPKPNKLNKLNEPKQPNKPVLLFTGAMDYYANMDGVTWFVDKIFSRIKQEWPKCQFYIVGSNPHSKVRDLERISGVSVTGFVEDTRPYYNAANVCVVPLRLARGVQNKVLEAMAMAKPVVTTTRAIEGIHAVPEEHVLIEDTGPNFFGAVSRLLKNQNLGNRLGARARAFVKTNYTWPTHMRKFETLLQEGPIIP